MADSVVEANNVENHHEKNDDQEEEHDPHFEPIIHLPEVHIAALEEEEDIICRLRAKLFRYDKSEEPHQWKERGTGDIKILYHPEKNKARVLMRRDQTFKICANHYITPTMELKPSFGSDRAWLWNVAADFADEVLKPELLAVRFANAENAKKFKEAFEAAQQLSQENPQASLDSTDEESEEESDEESVKDNKEETAEEKDTTETNKVAEKLGDMKVSGPEKSED